MFSFEDLRKIKKEEEAGPKLSRINPDFKEAVVVFVKQKEKESQEKRDLRELQNVKALLKEILEIRERKILMAALYYVRSGVTPENMVHEEREFFEAAAAKIKVFHDKVKGIIKGTESSMRVVVIKEAVPGFVGTNLHIYGPFRPGDMATVPEECVELLVKKGAAECVDFG